jgi:hypothetical protein
MHPAEPLIKLALCEDHPDASGWSASDVRAAYRVLADLFPGRCPVKTAASPLIEELKAVKRDSDMRNWRGKHAKLRSLMAKYPDDFYIDSRQGTIVGITHKTGFRFHMPYDKVAPVLYSRPMGKAPWLQDDVETASTETT